MIGRFSCRRRAVVAGRATAHCHARMVERRARPGGGALVAGVAYRRRGNVPARLARGHRAVVARQAAARRHNNRAVQQRIGEARRRLMAAVAGGP